MESRGRLALHWKILIGLVVGAAAGLIARQIWPAGPEFSAIGLMLVGDEPIVAQVAEDSSAAEAGVQAGDRVTEVNGQAVTTRNEAIDRFQAYRPGDAVRVALRRGDETIDVNSTLPAEATLTPNRKLEWFAANFAEFVGKLFLRIIFMVVVPLVVAALVLGIAEIGDVRKLGRMGLRTLMMTVILSGASVAIGLTLANVVRPGDGLSAEKRAQLQEKYQSQTDATLAQAGKAKTLRDMLLDMLPNNPLQEMVGALDGSSPGNGMLAVMMFSLLVGIAITLAPERTGTLVALLQGVFDVSMVIIGFAMRLAPLGVAGLMFTLATRLGVDILQTLAWYVATVLAGLALHMFVVYSLAVVVFARMSPWKFFSRISEVMLTAFATSSSNATLPTALRVTEERLNVKPEVSRFVLTVGATANQNGTALYEGITVLFLAQMFGVDLSLGQQLTVVFMSVLAGIGTAGVPGGSLPLVALVLLYVKVPAEGIGIILGVDRILDMCRTTLNVTGDVLIALCVDRQERAAETAPLGK